MRPGIFLVFESVLSRCYQGRICVNMVAMAAPSVSRLKSNRMSTNSNCHEVTCLIYICPRFTKCSCNFRGF